MKADLNTDFEALFNEALAQWKIRENALEPISKAKYSHILCGGNMSTDVYRKLEEDEIDVKIKYQNWIKKNITDRGITLLYNQCNGKPVSMYVTVAGAER